MLGEEAKEVLQHRAVSLAKKSENPIPKLQTS